jgi:hypothetical protein
LNSRGPRLKRRRPEYDVLTKTAAEPMAALEKKVAALRA